MPFITAERIHDGRKWLPAGTVVEINEQGAIISIGKGAGQNVTVYEGVLAPGLVNVHCHIELSHMKGAVPEHTGLISFLETIPLTRNNCTAEQKTMARQTAYNDMLENGIVAMGDIANTTDTLDVRAMDRLHVYTFVESIGFTSANAQRSFGYAVQAYDAFAAQAGNEIQLHQTIVPHAPYSVSSALFKLIDTHRPGAPISIHNQESIEENRFYTANEGGVRRLLKTLGIDDAEFTPTQKTSLQSYLEWLSANHPFIFVHNTFTSREDVQFAQQRLKEAYWCLCPNANLYIENRLPDVEMLMAEEVNICIGTDSLASNHQLSVMAELQTLKQHYPTLTWETLLGWGTYNGACALQMQDAIGTIAPGKKPGIIQIMGIGTKPKVKRIV